MTLTNALDALGWIPVCAGWALWLASLLSNDKYLDWLSTGCLAVGSWLWFLSTALQRDWGGAAINGLVAAWNSWLWWKNRRDRRRGKASLALGAKSRAVIEEMAAKLKPSPIPSPIGA